MCEPAPLRLVSVEPKRLRLLHKPQIDPTAAGQSHSRRFVDRWRTDAAGSSGQTGRARAGAGAGPQLASGGRGACAPGGLRVVAGQLHAAALTPRARHGRRLATEIRDDRTGAAARRAGLRIGESSLVGGRHRRRTLAARRRRATMATSPPRVATHHRRRGRCTSATSAPRCSRGSSRARRTRRSSCASTTSTARARGPASPRRSSRTSRRSASTGTGPSCASPSAWTSIRRPSRAWTQAACCTPATARAPRFATPHRRRTGRRRTGPTREPAAS